MTANIAEHKIMNEENQMKLCDHILSIYRNEIEHGNQPLYISTPKYVDKNATAEIYVIMKHKLQDYNLDGIQEYRYTDYRFPQERYFGCPVCGHYISGPLDEKQLCWFDHSDSEHPNDKVIATNENIYIANGVYGKQMVPTLCLK